MARQRNRTQFRDQRGDCSEDSTFQRGLHGGGKAQCDQATNSRQVDFDRRIQEFCAMTMVVPEKIADQHGGHVGSGDGSGPAGPHGAHRRGSPFPVDEKPIA